MAQHFHHISEPWMTLIAASAKTVEGRLKKGSFSEMQVGDLIAWYNDDFGFRREVHTLITGLTTYSSFLEYLRAESLDKCLPAYGVCTLEEGAQVYRQYYSSLAEAEHGVLAITLSANTKQ